MFKCLLFCIMSMPLVNNWWAVQSSLFILSLWWLFIVTMISAIM